MKKIIILLIYSIFFISQNVFADCVYNAKSKTSYIILNNHTIILKGGWGDDVLIKSYSFFYKSSEISILKDSFCSYDNSVLYVDDEIIDVTEVKRI